MQHLHGFVAFIPSVFFLLKKFLKSFILVHLIEFAVILCGNSFISTGDFCFVVRLQTFVEVVTKLQSAPWRNYYLPLHEILPSVCPVKNL